MDFSKEAFGSNNAGVNFEEGNIYYLKKEDRYQFFKVLRLDTASQTVHVKIYGDLDRLPDISQVDKLPIKIYHAPIDTGGFENPVLLTKSTVEDEDLLGYFEFIKQTRNMDEIVYFAKKSYKEAYFLSEQHKHEEAITKCSIAIDLIPNFYEAIDNRGFSKMDMGRLHEAIEDFQHSLQINPQGALAAFKIGECYLRMGAFPQAEEYFSKAIQIDPGFETKHQDFLAFARRLMNQ